MLPIHQSMLPDLWSCPRRWAYQYVVGLGLRQTPSYFTEGSLVHQGLAMWRHPSNKRFTTEGRRELIEERLRASGEEQDIVANALGYLAKAIDYDLKEPLRVDIVEPYLEMATPEGITLAGTPDGIISDYYGKIWTVEYKTAQSPNSRYLLQLTTAPQAGFYYLLIDANLEKLGLPSRPLGGTIFEIIPKAAKDNQVRREPAVVSAQVRERVEQYITDSTELISSLMAEGHWPRCLDACYGKFGTECQFMPWCYRGGNIDVRHADLLGTLYDIVAPEERRASRLPKTDEYILNI